ADVEDAGDVVVDAVRDAHDAVGKPVEVATDHADLDPRLQSRGEQSDRSAAGDAHAGDPVRIELRPRLQVVDGAHHVPGAPADHRLAEQERGAGRGLAGGGAGPTAPGAVIAAMAEAKWLDGERRVAVSHGLQGEVVLI